MNKNIDYIVFKESPLPDTSNKTDLSDVKELFYSVKADSESARSIARTKIKKDLIKYSELNDETIDKKVYAIQEAIDNGIDHSLKKGNIDTRIFIVDKNITIFVQTYGPFNAKKATESFETSLNIEKMLTRGRGFRLMTLFNDYVAVHTNNKVTEVILGTFNYN